MKNKISTLIIGCIFTVLALLTIQGYLIYNTYKLKEKELTNSVKIKLNQLDNRTDPEKERIKDDAEQELIVHYSNGKINKKQLITALKKIETKDAKIELEKITREFKKTNYEVGYSKNIASIISVNNDRKVMLLNENIELYGTKTKPKDQLVLNTSNWFTSGTHSVETEKNKTKETKEINYTFEIKRIYYYSINNINQLIFSEMIGLLLVSFFLMSFVIILFYISLKNGIKQKKMVEMQRDFINNITHEFKTPLATLSIATKTLNKNNLDDEMVRNTVAIIERQNNRLQNIVNQVNFDSLLLNVTDLKLQQNINKNGIENCITDFQMTHPAIKIVSELNTKTIDLKMSKFHFNTILVNLLENAVKYGGTQITISTKRNLNSFILSIKDNGIGIQKKEQNAIFEKFYRIQNGDIHNNKGLGLGLFYTREIIESHQGKVHIESQENKGSIFIISIPIQ